MFLVAFSAWGPDVLQIACQVPTKSLARCLPDLSVPPQMYAQGACHLTCSQREGGPVRRILTTTNEQHQKLRKITLCWQCPLHKWIRLAPSSSARVESRRRPSRSSRNSIKVAPGRHPLLLLLLLLSGSAFDLEQERKHRPLRCEEVMEKLHARYFQLPNKCSAAHIPPGQGGRREGPSLAPSSQPMLCTSQCWHCNVSPPCTGLLKLQSGSEVHTCMTPRATRALDPRWPRNSSKHLPIGNEAVRLDMAPIRAAQQQQSVAQGNVTRRISLITKRWHR